MVVDVRGDAFLNADGALSEPKHLGWIFLVHPGTGWLFPAAVV